MCPTNRITHKLALGITFKYTVLKINLNQPLELAFQRATVFYMHTIQFGSVHYLFAPSSDELSSPTL